MRNTIIIYILFTIFALVGIASASETILLTDTNVALPPGFVVTLITDTSSSPNTMSIQLTGVPSGYNPNDFKMIKEVFYNLDPNIYKVTKVTINGNDVTSQWTLNQDGKNVASFGTFNALSDPKTGNHAGWGIIYPIIFEFNQIAPLGTNNDGHNAAAHILFGDTTINAVDSTWITNGIPEFPTVALPIAAVIGLVFFFQNKKKKEE